MKSTAKKGGTQRVRRRATTTSTRPRSLPDGTWERIAQKAYELWELRGLRHGYALQDWLDAELLVMDEIHEARR
jgi:hypothetical protein